MDTELSSFNPDTFIDTEYEEAIDTTIIPIPIGDYKAQADSVKFRKQMTKDGERALMDIFWEILDEKVKEITGLPKPVCKQTIFLDINEAGGLDMSKGKNRQIGLLRDALGQNVEGQRWSAGMIEGNLATVKITHTQDKEDSEIIYSNVKKVTVA